MMGLDHKKYRPHAHITNHARMIYMFDAWPKEYDRIIRFVDQCAIDMVFVSARRSAMDLNQLAKREIFHYVPEGVDPAAYRFAPYLERDIDVLALGRKYDRFHQAILPGLQRNQRTYLYEPEKGQLVFPDRKGMIHGLSRTRISICVPGSMTHPERSGHVETMTMRYLQSMASKCLILGHAPAEMIDLFGYNPVIEIDWEQTENQIEDILRTFHLYIPLIERNYREVLTRHTWEQRFEEIKRRLKGVERQRQRPVMQ